MYDTGYYATGHYATGYYMRGVVAPPVDIKRGPFIDRLKQYTDLAIREDEEMIILIRAFLEILNRWH